MKAKILLVDDEADRSGSVKPAENRILVVDDDSSVREMLTRVLVGEGYLVWAAADGTAALEIAAAAKVDLVLLDLNLPGKSGWDTFERLTAENPVLAVIIITARSNQLFTALGAGVGALLEKPLDFPKLLLTISQLLAEPVESRVARLAGSPANFHHAPAQRKEQSHSPDEHEYHHGK
jgi:DNA-binding response OmpR family regulator